MGVQVDKVVDIALEALGTNVVSGLINQIPDLVCVCVDHKVAWINDAGARLVGDSHTDNVIGQSFSTFLAGDYLALGDEFLSLMEDENSSIRTRMQGCNGELWDSEIRVSRYPDDSARVHLVIAHDITEVSRMADSLQRNKARLRDLVNSSLSMICECHDGKVSFLNDTGLRLLGASTEAEVLGKPIDQLFHADYRDLFTDALDILLAEPGFLTLRLRRLDGRHIDVEAALTRLHGSSGKSFLAEARDITKQNETTRSLRAVAYDMENRDDERIRVLQDEIKERRKIEGVLRHSATHDVLTGLPNRNLLPDRLKHAMKVADRKKDSIALMFIDLDGFKAVNDSFGHEAGDRVLVQVAEILRASTRLCDTIVRIGGDEFVILLTSLTGRKGPTIVASKIIELLQQKFPPTSGEPSVGASIGIAMYPEDGRDVEQLLALADRAMYDVKAMGKNNFRFISDC